MLRDLGNTERSSHASAPAGAATVFGVGADLPASPSPPPPPRLSLLILHHGDRRLASLEAVLGELGYCAAVAATGEEVLAAFARGPHPDVLIAGHCPGESAAAGARRGVGFARGCLGQWPALRALYVTFVPGLVPEVAAGREAALAAPFNAEQLAAALARLGPAAA